MTRDTLKTMRAVLSGLALVPVVAGAYQVGSPVAGTVMVATYYPSGAFHGAVDVFSGAVCSFRNVDTAVVASLAWNVTVRTAGLICDGTGIPGNEAKHVFASGYTFRLTSWSKNSNSYSRTCDRCVIGGETSSGSPTIGVHLASDKSGTPNTAWYSGTVKGEYLDHGEIIGNVG